MAEAPSGASRAERRRGEGGIPRHAGLSQGIGTLVEGHSLVRRDPTEPGLLACLEKFEGEAADVRNEGWSGGGWDGGAQGNEKRPAVWSRGLRTLDSRACWRAACRATPSAW